MKITSTISLVLALSASGLALAQSAGMNHAAMPGMQQDDKPNAQAGKKGQGDKQAAPVHQAMAIVRAVDPCKGTVMLAHEAIASLDWPAMTMGFKVNNSKLFSQLVVGKKVNVEFTKQGSDYVVTAVK